MAGKWRFRHKLMLGLGLVLAIMGLMLAGTLNGLLSFRATLRTASSRLPELEGADKVRDALKALPDPRRTELPIFMESIAKAKNELLDFKTTLLDNTGSGSSAELEQVRALEEGFKGLEEALSQSQRPGVENPLSGPQDRFAKVKTAIDPLVQTSDDLHNVLYKDLLIRVGHSRSDIRHSFAIVLFTTVVGVLLMLGLLRFFYRWVFYPIRDLKQGVDHVGQGNFEHHIDVRSGDEIEDLAEAFNDMSSRLREMYRDLARQVNERSRQLVRSERLAGVGFLAAGVAHEINNPLAGIAFCSEALERRLKELLETQTGRPLANLDQEREIVTKYLKMIQDEAFRCKEITQKLLEFSRGGERRREPTDLAELIQGVLDLVQHMQNSKGKELIFRQNQPLTAWVNGQEIKSVVLNLVVNALDSMDEGGTLAITLGQRDGMAELHFQDSGCGMTGEVLENIFEPFFTRSRTGKGTGLGLSISHRIINQHGGDIEAQSPGPNQGSTFTVRVPLQPVEENEKLQIADCRLQIEGHSVAA